MVEKFRTTIQTKKEILDRLNSGQSPYKRGNSMTKNNRIARNLGSLERKGLVKSKKISETGAGIGLGFGASGSLPRKKWQLTDKGKKTYKGLKNLL